MPGDNAEDVAPARPPDRELLGLAQTLGAVLAGVGNNFCFRLLAALPVSELVVMRALAGAALLAPLLVLERSEEHTSELQSLMRISYGVFCLKKKKYTHKLINRDTPT